MTTLSSDSLRDVARRVFGEKSTTLNEAGRDIPIADFRETISAIRADMEAALHDLPDSAFSEQQAGEGGEIWAAGQIIAHVSNAFYSMSSQVRPLVGMPEIDLQPAHDMGRHPSRTEALAVLSQMDDDTNAFFEGIPADGDFTTTVQHRFFGEIDTKGWLMVMAVHENDHLTQLRALGA